MYRHVRLGTAVKCTKYSLLQRTDLGQGTIRTIHRTGMLWNAPEAGLFPMWGAIHHLPPSAYHRVPYNQTYWTNLADGGTSLHAKRLLAPDLVAGPARAAAHPLAAAESGQYGFYFYLALVPNHRARAHFS